MGSDASLETILDNGHSLGRNLELCLPVPKVVASLVRCKPRGFYTSGKGADRVVHPICGRGMSIGQTAHRMRIADSFARNHSLKTGPPITVPSLETYRESMRRQKIITPRRVGVKPSKLAPVEKKVRKRQAGLARKKKGEAGLNMRVTGALVRRYPGQLALILEQANAAYHYRNPGLEVNPEPYELSEGGYIDEALESLGLGHVRTFGS